MITLTEVLTMQPWDVAELPEQDREAIVEMAVAGGDEVTDALGYRFGAAMAGPGWREPDEWDYM